MNKRPWLERFFCPKMNSPAPTQPARTCERLGNANRQSHFRPLAHARDGADLEMGSAVPEGARLSYPFSELAGAHFLCGAATGHGKTRFVAGLAMKHIRTFARTGAPGVVLIDPKAETVDLVLRLLAAELPQWPTDERDRVLARLRVIAPCRRDAAITPLQLLAAPRAEAESRAAEVSEAITQGIEADMGILQEGVLANVLALAIESQGGWSLAEVPHLLSNDALLRQMASRSSLAGPRAYVLSGRFGREATQRISGIQARIEKLLRVERLRLALAAPELLDLGESFRGAVTFIDLGSDYGAEDATRIVGRLIFSRLVASLFAQPPETLTPTFLVCEEFPDLLGKGLGARTEKLFAQARSRKTGCMILFQAPTQLQQGGLLRVLQANARFTILGQMPEAEVHCFEELLLATGRVGRRIQPGEVLPKTAFLSPSEERTHRQAQVASLEKGVFLFSDRHRRERTCFFRADHCEPPTWNELERHTPEAALSRVRHGSISLPLAEAEASYRRRLERFVTVGNALPTLPVGPAPLGPPASLGPQTDPGEGQRFRRAASQAPGDSVRPRQPTSRRSRRRRGDVP